MRFLDGPRFKQALEELDGATAAQAMHGVRRVRESLRAAWMSFVLEAPRLESGAVRSTPAAAAERCSRQAARSVKSALDHVLGLVGLGLGDLGERESGLRELTVTGTTPALRVLYGLDVPGQCLVALIGDALTRTYYGDSVRRAEQRWSEYLGRGQLEERSRTRPHSP